MISRSKWVAAVVVLVAMTAAGQTIEAPTPQWAAGLQKEADTIGKPAWRPMLDYAVTLHIADTHPAEPPFPYPWEEIGRGYGYGPAFGHWDLIHEVIDELPAAPEHAREQLLNDLALQLPSGFLPGAVWMRKPKADDDKKIYNVNSASPLGRATYSDTQGHPPVWVVAADDYMQQTGDKSLAPKFLAAVTSQIGWFERERRAKPDGFLYSDIVTGKWESGVDEGVRFDGTGPGHEPASTACVDATAHVYQMYVYAAKWAKLTGQDPTPFAQKAAHLRKFMQTKLWSERDSFFYDSWVLDRAPDGPRSSWKGTLTPGRAHPFEGFWPMMVGAATPLQAHRVIVEWLMRKDRFFTPHPVATVSADDPKFELRMWRGPTWNSMTYWAARGVAGYGDKTDAHRLLEAALDDTAAQFARTGLIWEFYHPMGGHPEDLKRKPQTSRNMPFSDYSGHNPLLAMTRLWVSTGAP